MGFGYLLIGYLVTFVLYLTVETLGFGWLALLLGYVLMALGLRELCRFCRAFGWSLWLLVPMLVPTLYDALVSLRAWFAWNLPVVTPTVSAVMEWVFFFLMITFNVAMLYGIRVIAARVELPSTVAAAVRNSLFVGAYAVVYVVSRLPFAWMAAATPYLGVVLVVFNLAWLFCNLGLLLSCNKNICRADDVEQTPKESRMGWLNRLNAAYEKNHETLTNAGRENREAALERQRERRTAREKKKIHHKKKK